MRRSVAWPGVHAPRLAGADAYGGRGREQVAPTATGRGAMAAATNLVLVPGLLCTKALWAPQIAAWPTSPTSRSPITRATTPWRASPDRSWPPRLSGSRSPACRWAATSPTRSPPGPGAYPPREPWVGDLRAPARGPDDLLLGRLARRGPQASGWQPLEGENSANRDALGSILRRSAVPFRDCAMTIPRRAARATRRPRDKPLRKFAGAVWPEDLSCARSCQWFARVAGS